MPALSHVALTIALCPNVSKAPADAAEPIRVRMMYRVGDPEYDKTFSVKAGDGTQVFHEFDIRSGQYLLAVEAPKLGCSGTRFVHVLAERNRKIAVALESGPPAPEPPQMLLEGDAPMSFLYTKPTYVFVDKAVACNAPIGKPVMPKIDSESDTGAFYLWLYPDPALAGTDPTLALRLRTPTGLAHYIRVPVAYSEIGPGWPADIQFNLDEDVLDSMATEKTDVLLCPKLFETKVR